MGLVGNLLTMVGPWGWWIAGLVFAAIEVFAPGTYFLWLGIAALIVGTIALVQDIGWQVQCLLFVILSVASALVGRRFYGQQAPAEGDDQFLNDRSGRQVGRQAVVERSIVNGVGEIRLDDTVWRVEGPDMPVGTRVKVASARDGRLRVEPL
jgi:membrane protein implicated in regulation of membrane protease activity